MFDHFFLPQLVFKHFAIFLVLKDSPLFDLFYQQVCLSGTFRPLLAPALVSAGVMSRRSLALYIVHGPSGTNGGYCPHWHPTKRIFTGIDLGQLG